MQEVSLPQPLAGLVNNSDTSLRSHNGTGRKKRTQEVGRRSARRLPPGDANHSGKKKKPHFRALGPSAAFSRTPPTLHTPVGAVDDCGSDCHCFPTFYLFFLVRRRIGPTFTCAFRFYTGRPGDLKVSTALFKTPAARLESDFVSRCRLSVSLALSLSLSLPACSRSGDVRARTFRTRCRVGVKKACTQRRRLPLLKSLSVAKHGSPTPPAPLPSSHMSVRFCRRSHSWPAPSSRCHKGAQAPGPVQRHTGATTTSVVAPRKRADPAARPGPVYARVQQAQGASGSPTMTAARGEKNAAAVVVNMHPPVIIYSFVQSEY